MTYKNQIDLVIRNCEAKRRAAMLGGNMDIFSYLLHPDLTYVHSNGAVDNLKSYLEKCRSREFIYHSLDYQIDKVTLVGEIAIAFGEMTTTVTSGTQKKNLNNRTVTAWQKTDNRWQLLLYQATPLKPAVVLNSA